jgi:FKBP-type peptidyl-prolyl cis-trans isomerase FkpA
MRNFAASVLLASSFFVAAAPAFAADPKTDEEKTFYTIGVITGRQMGIFKMTPAQQEFMRAGQADAMNGAQLKVNPEEYGPKVQKLAQTNLEKLTNEEAKKGKDFLAAAAKEKGVTKTKSGIVIRVEKEGTGEAPKKTDTVKVNYEGTFVDGVVFDSSFKRNEPAQFQLDQVIPCWTEVVGMMKPGGKVKAICPAETAYGDKPTGPIPPKSTLVFSIELLEIVKK